MVFILYFISNVFLLSCNDLSITENLYTYLNIYSFSLRMSSINLKPPKVPEKQSEEECDNTLLILCDNSLILITNYHNERPSWEENNYRNERPSWEKIESTWTYWCLLLTCSFCLHVLVFVAETRNF